MNENGRGDSKRSVGHLHDDAAAELLLGTAVVGHLHLLDLGSRARSVRSGLRMDLHGKGLLDEGGKEIIKKMAAELTVGTVR